MGLLGAHLSIAGGLHLAIERGEDLQCEAIQIFTQSSRSWKGSPLTADSISNFKKARMQAKSVRSVIAHNSYLLNLSTSNEPLRQKSIACFLENYERCEALDIEGLVTHPGSHLGAGLETGIKKTVDSLNEILKQTRGYKSLVMLENTAGQGDCIGSQFEDLQQILERVKEPERVFFCFDTQHAFAAGYDLSHEKGIQAVFKKWDKLLSLKRIRAFHLNDALKGLGSRVDRHENLGKGFLGNAVFKYLVNHAKFKNTPMCLETFPGEDNENYRVELPLLRSYKVKG